MASTPSKGIRQESRSKKVDVSELSVGMWVSRLDRDWLETPFLLQGFLLETPEDIETVQSLCKFVWIDESIDTWHQHQKLQPLKAAPSTPVYVNKVSAMEENQRVLGLFREARKITRNFLQQIQLQGMVNTQVAKDLVNDCVFSILQNPDALLWMSKIREQDNYTSEHCLNVCILAIAFGRHLGMDESELQKLGLCGLLHDVGKMKVPTDVLNKPGKLLGQEWEVMQSHTTHGRNLLMASGSDAAIAVDVAWNHHESLDGSGYPRGLKAPQISRLTRIISIVDAYDAMTAKRCYKPAMTSTKALKILFDEKGKAFDEDLVEAFTQAIGLYPPGSLVELLNGQVGLVFEVHETYRHLPKVILLLDKFKRPMKPKIVNLSLIQEHRLDKSYLICEVHTDGSWGISVKLMQEQGLKLS